MKSKIILIAALFAGFQLQAQTSISSAEEMSKLAMLVGDWQGTGWHQQGKSERIELTQTEHIESKLNGTLILVEGKGYIQDSLFFNALAMFTYNSIDKNYSIESHLSDGKATLASGIFKEDGTFEWGFDLPHGQIRYTITLTNTTWYEYGEYSPDGSQWYKFMEMNLTKK